MNYTTYKNDPFWLNAKFGSKCGNCNKEIVKGERIYYYPKTKTAMCEKCGKGAEREFISIAQDESAYMSGYGGY